MITLDKENLEVILDVLNVYDPEDIEDVYPEMGEQAFLDGVKETFHKVLKMLNGWDDLYPDGAITEGDKKLMEMINNDTIKQG